MKKDKKHFKNMTILFMLLCFLLVSCDNVQNTVTRVKDNSDFNLIETIKPHKIHSISENHLTRIFECDRIFVSSSVKTNSGMHVFVNGTLNDDLIHETRVYMYDMEENAHRKKIIEGVHVVRIIYDEQQQKLLLFQSEEKQSRLHGRQGIEKPDIVIALNMNLEEQWRLQVYDYIRDIVTIGEYYYILRQKEETPFDNVIFYSPTYVDRVDSTGRIVATFHKDDFAIREVIAHDSSFIIFGVQMERNQHRVLVIYGDKATFFTEKYTVIPNQDRVEFGVISNEVLMVTGRKGLEYRDSGYFINLIDLTTMNIINTFDISETASKYEIDARGVFWGKNHEQIGILGTAKIGSKLAEARRSVMFFPISYEFEVSTAYVIEIGLFDFSWIICVSMANGYLHVLCLGRNIIYPFKADNDDDGLISFSIRQYNR